MSGDFLETTCLTTALTNLGADISCLLVSTAWSNCSFSSSLTEVCP